MPTCWMLLTDVYRLRAAMAIHWLLTISLSKDLSWACIESTMLNQYERIYDLLVLAMDFSRILLSTSRQLERGRLKSFGNQSLVV